jgi:CHRD domain-containing protein
MKKLFAALVLAAAGVLAAVAVARADAPLPTTFVAVMSADEEVPGCPPAGSGARGLAIFHVVDQDTGTVRWKIIANNLPGTIVAAHIHQGPRGVAAPVVQPTPPTPGEENGVVGEGTFTNPALLAGMQADPQAYYVNVHTDICPPGAIRGQLGEHGPPGTAEG